MPILGDQYIQKGWDINLFWTYFSRPFLIFLVNEGIIAFKNEKFVLYFDEIEVLFNYFKFEFIINANCSCFSYVQCIKYINGIHI